MGASGAHRDLSGLTVVKVPKSKSDATYFKCVSHNLMVTKEVHEQAARARQLVGLTCTSSAQRKVYAWLEKMLKPKAATLLRALKKKHLVSTSSATVAIPGTSTTSTTALTSVLDIQTYDGLEMLRSMRSMRKDRLPTQDSSVLFHERRYDREHAGHTLARRLGAVKDYTDKVNELLDLHLPHFVNIKLEGSVALQFATAARAGRPRDQRSSAAVNNW